MIDLIQKLEVSEWTSIGAILVSFCALGLTIWQGILTRKHNILSVKPYLDITWSNIEAERLACTLENNGIGTAFLNEITYFYQGQEFPIEDKLGYFALFQSMGLDDDASNVHITHLQTHSSIPQGGSITLFDFKSVVNDKGVHQVIASKIRNIEIQAEYKCIYGKTYQTSKSSLW